MVNSDIINPLCMTARHENVKKKFNYLISFSSLSDPDPKQIVTDPDPDAGKSYGSDRIRIRNTEIKLKNPSGGYTLTLLLFNQNLFNTKKDNDNNLVFFFKPKGALSFTGFI